MDDCSQVGPGDGDRISTLGGGAADSPTPAGESRREELRAAVKAGLLDIEEGRVVDLEGALDRIEAMLDEMEALKRA